VASDAELKMSREVKVLQSRVEQLSGAVHQLREKEKYQRYQVTNVLAATKRGKSLLIFDHL
jgi:hypothetical protein